jgi:integrase
MTRRKRLTDDGVANLKPGASRYAHPDPEMHGHYVRVTPTGSKSYVVVALDPNGKQIWHTIGTTSELRIDAAREKARDAIAAIKSGGDRGGPQSFAKVSSNWFARHVEANALRSTKEIRYYLDRWLLPAWAGRDFESIKRGDVAKLLDHVEDGSGPVAATKCLSVISRICQWHATRNDNYVSPIVRGMERSSIKDRARTRILSNDELRAVWKQAEANGTFGAMVRLLLLTGQRKEKVISMRWSDLSNGVWTIPAEKREKGNAGELKLSRAALDIIEAQPRYPDNPYVLVAPSRTDVHYSGNARAKETFDARLPAMPHWQLHDLRRTARSLMSRAGVRPDIAERVLGHAIRGVEGVYDRHDYSEQKAHALAALASLIQTIVSGNGKGKVVKLRA